MPLNDTVYQVSVKTKECVPHTCPIPYFKSNYNKPAFNKLFLDQPEKLALIIWSY